MRSLFLLVSINICFADNIDFFNKAYQFGKQNQVHLNLNTNSTIDSYSQTNSFDGKIAENANIGNSNAKNMYDNTNGEHANPNYLYNEGIKDIDTCKKRSDPRCTTINKYGDQDTQTQIQAYQQGVSHKYYISIKPDPNDTRCSNVITKKPINPADFICVAGTHYRKSCEANLNIWLDTYECDPNSIGCEIYQKNPDCKLVRPYIPGECKTWQYTVWYGCTSSTNITCANGSQFGSPGWCGGGYETRLCSGVDYGSGRGTNPICIERTQAQLATYVCKNFNYNDGCSGF